MHFFGGRIQFFYVTSPSFLGDGMCISFFFCEVAEVGLSARRNMCVHPEVSKEGDRERVDETPGSESAGCKEMQGVLPVFAPA